MGKIKDTNPSRYLPYTPNNGNYKYDEKNFDTRDTVFYRGLKFSNEVDYDELFEIVNYTKFLFDNNDVGKYVEEHLTTNVAFVPYCKTGLLTWYLEYDGSVFKVKIRDTDIVNKIPKYAVKTEYGIFGWLARRSAFVPVTIIDPKCLKLFIFGKDPNFQSFSFSYRVWLNNSIITDDFKDIIARKKRSNLASYEDKLTIIFSGGEGKHPILLDTVDAEYLSEEFSVDSRYITYEEFAKKESKNDPIFRRYYNEKVGFKDLYKGRRSDTLIDDIVTDMDLEARILFILSNPDRYDVTYRYLSCFLRLCKWADEYSISIDDDYIMFFKDIKDCHNRPERYMIELYRDSYKIYDPIYQRYCEFNFELDISELTWCLFADSSERKDYIEKLSIDNKEGIVMKQEEKVDVEKIAKEVTDPNNDALLSMADEIDRNYNIIVKEFIPYIMHELCDANNSVDITMQSCLRDISKKDKEVIYRYGVYGVIADVTAALKGSLKPEEINVITSGMMEDFIQFTIENYDILLFNDLYIYKGENDADTVMKLVVESVDFKQKMYAMNKEDLSKLIHNKFKDNFYFDGSIVYENGDIIAYNKKEIRYATIYNSIKDIELLLIENDKKEAYLVAGSNIIESATYNVNTVLNLGMKTTDALDSSDFGEMSIINIQRVDMYNGVVSKAYEKFISNVFKVISRMYNSVKSF